MGKGIDLVRLAKYKRARLEGKDKQASILAAGFSVNTAKAQNKHLKLVRVGDAQLEKELSNEDIIKELRSILKLKLELEKKVFLDALTIKNRKLRLQVLNKTKDNIAEITKTLRLVEGDSTANIQVTEKEKTAKYNRMKEYMTAG